MKQIFFGLLIVFNFSLYGQYMAFQEIDESRVSKWLPKVLAEYSGAYHFGDSEGESTLILFFTNTDVIAQIKSGRWSLDGKDWVWQYDNLTDVRIEKDGKFYSKEYNGEFVFYKSDEQLEKCLKIYDSWSGILENSGEYELGYRLDPLVKAMYSGKYPEASINELDPKELSKMTLDELKIMRNEIFARYGYKFREGGQMDRYFRKQEWYRPQHSNVSSFLTKLEKRNIALIRKEER